MGARISQAESCDLEWPARGRHHQQTNDAHGGRERGEFGAQSANAFPAAQSALNRTPSRRGATQATHRRVCGQNGKGKTPALETPRVRTAVVAVAVQGCQIRAQAAGSCDPPPRPLACAFRTDSSADVAIKADRACSPAQGPSSLSLGEFSFPPHRDRATARCPYSRGPCRTRSATRSTAGGWTMSTVSSMPQRGESRPASPPSPHPR
jgi:hypothetical protein